MSLGEIVALLALGLSALNALLLMLTFIRAGRWKDGEDARHLIGRVGVVEGDVTTLKAQMQNVATKADVAGITASLNALGADIRAAERGVDRIEGLLMKERV
mgnify:CR=1 FL=1